MLNGLIAGIKTRCGGVISCLYSGATDDDRIVLIDPGPEVIPHLSLRLGQIDVATPDPRTFFLVELDQGQRLRIMHDHEICVTKLRTLFSKVTCSKISFLMPDKSISPPCSTLCIFLVIEKNRAFPQSRAIPPASRGCSKEE